ncbi:uncharacterized protein FA14DRAFT_182598 [Meira miltonrushii]|uniref:Uncharacterized protein n=1 Tax=Meira miltonrushii TaxID=1280837 RepID=A0A316V2M9_9BASI|nr:uncharacterized protein FA14DRAFT_182598 [Meira miltonrushii]PWN31809.1 hypothetical protein FA14DRAFT_182598 [Meira miltonrushii]
MTTASPIDGSKYSNTGQAGAYANSAYSPSTTTNGSNNNMYSQHGHHLHANAYGSSTANTGSNHHTSSTDTGLAPQSSFDTVPGSQHTGSLHQSPSSGGGGWGQSMHYSNSTNGANAYNSQAHGMYGSGGYYGSAGGAQTPSGAVTGSNGAGSGAYSAYGMQPHQGGPNAGANQPHSAYSGSGALAGGLNGSTGGGSAHHSGSSTPTSQTPYHHQHPHSVGSVFPSPQGYPTHHQGGYYGAHGNASSNSVSSVLLCSFLISPDSDLGRNSF